MTRRLLFIGGVLNSAFFLFHLLLAYQISRLVQLAPPHRALMEALNAAGALFLFFFAYASFVHGKELLETGLGRVVLVLASALYLSRAAEEFFLFPFNLAIFSSCLFVGAIYAALFVIALQEKPQPTLTTQQPRELRRVS